MPLRPYEAGIFAAFLTRQIVIQSGIYYSTVFIERIVADAIEHFFRPEMAQCLFKESSASNIMKHSGDLRGRRG
jgi:hypothetical protein